MLIRAINKAGESIRANNAVSHEEYRCEYCSAKLYLKTSREGRPFLRVIPGNNTRLILVKGS